MKTYVLYSILIFYFHAFIKCYCECAVGTEDSSIRLLCKVTSAVNRLITWQVDKGDGYVDMTTCHMNGVCTSNSPDFYSFLTGTNCTIHVRSLNRNMSSWRCVWDDEHYGPPCNITVYVPPRKPACDPPLFVNSNTAVSVTCRTEKTYPVAQCLFTQYTNKGALNNSRVEHKHSPSPISSQDFATECTFVSDLVPVSQPMTLTLGIKMISLPNTAPVFGENISIDLSEDNTAWLKVFELWDGLDLMKRHKSEKHYPVPDLDLDCPRDYIMPESTASCTCKLSNLGSPPGQSHWFSPNIDKILSFPKTNGSSQLDFSFNSSAPDPVYYCYAISSVGQPFSTVIYEPKFAFGPSQVYLEAMTSPTIHYSSTASVLIRCNVSRDQVLPGVVFNFESTSKSFPNWPYHSEGQFYTSSLIYTPLSPGMSNVTCRVHNSKFVSMTAQNTLRIQAYGGSAHIKLDIPGLLDVDLCSRTTITMSCKVAVTQAYPATTSYLYFNNKVYVARTSYEKETVHNLNFNFLPSTPGRFEVRCRAQNNYTSVLLGEEVNVITVSGVTCGLNTLTIGVAVGLGCSLLILLIVLVMFVLWRRRQSKSKEQEKKAVYFTVEGSKVKFVMKDDTIIGSNKLVSEPSPDNMAYADYDKPRFIPRVTTRQKQVLHSGVPAYTTNSMLSRASLSQKSNVMETESHIYSTVDG